MLVQRRQYLLWTLVISFAIYVYYFSIDNKRFSIDILYNETTVLNETQDFLINTPGCAIPNYAKTFTYNDTILKSATVKKLIASACGERAIFVDSLGNNTIKFRIDKKKMDKYLKRVEHKIKGKYRCCYKFASQSTIPGHENDQLAYTTCKVITQNSKVVLKDEVIFVTCITPKNKDNISLKVYEDAYKLVMKKDNSKSEMKGSWNILMLGVDTMSRKRLLDNMPLTSRYLKDLGWLDYKGYQKVEYNTFPNLMSVLTGKKMSTVYSKCSTGLFKCADFFIWDKFKNATYKTAYGEDNLSLPDTFSKYNGFKSSPTDHYMRPFYLLGERRYGNILCLQKKPSATHLLEYAQKFVESYKNNNYFGMFWINSYTHNTLDNPSFLDGEIVNFFEKLNNTGALETTFVIFFSDHGIRYGKMRHLMESYYDERLPMLFLWIPHEFRRQHSQKYNNLILNQHRLTTPYDIYLTLADILKLSTNSSDVISSEACPQCTSLFEIKSPYRTCADAGVKEQWCSCHTLSSVKTEDTRTNRSVELAVLHIQSILKSIKTIPCMECLPLKLGAVLRSHLYNDNNKTVCVIAFRMSSDSSSSNMDYEAVVNNYNNTYNVLSVRTISTYNTHGNCVLNRNQRAYCLCAVSKKCS